LTVAGAAVYVVVITAVKGENYHNHRQSRSPNDDRAWVVA
jgi:hypothetical protein